jgi:hypothetical protein
MFRNAKKIGLWAVVMLLVFVGFYVFALNKDASSETAIKECARGSTDPGDNAADQRSF